MKTRVRLARAALLGAALLAAGITGAVVYCTAMPGESLVGELPPLSGTEREVAGQLERHVRALSVDIGVRRAIVGDSLKRAERYLQAELSSLTATAGVALHREPIPSAPGDPANLVLDLAGARKGPIILVGAHYDSAPGGTPAANDNASGTAAALVLARRLALAPRGLPLRFVLFANEEMPYFTSETMGSLVHARGCAARGEELRAMFSLETMGYFSNAPGSQKYPPPLSALYPDRGNFIGFVADLRSRPLLRESLRSFRQHATVPSEGASLPASLPGVGWSDHWAFWQQGYEAVMITDTALFRDPNYHLGSDTVDKLDFERLARVVVGLEGVLRDLSTR